MGTTKFEDVGVSTYQEISGELKTGDILFCSGNYLISELIKKISNSIFSHVAIIIKLEADILLMESVEDDGVRIVPLLHYLENYENSNNKYDGSLYIARHKVLANLDDDDERIKSIVKRGIKLLNRSYDKAEIASIVARIGLGLGKHKENNEYICSEFVDECFKQAKIQFLSDSQGFIYPEHIAADQNVQPITRVVP